ncbi:MAG: hypothetical protein KF760_29410 [Candidatus Eremiobacteraeota bacterium]|nr:hypothetical protein [Candidatus Eremiobacteraeota bacterium]MCW5872089.1 hypothetical protein [Candidatus Eremiobacteraeota bacterium]
MTFEEEAHEWPAYDGLGDENFDELPVQEGDVPRLEDLDVLQDWLEKHPSGLDYFDQFVQQALFWLREELETEALLLDLSNVRATIQQNYGPKLKPFLARPLKRLRHAIEAEEEEMTLHLLIKLSDVFRARPAPLEKPYWAPKI